MAKVSNKKLTSTFDLNTNIQGEFFKDYFLPALYKGKIRIDSNNNILYLEMPDRVVKTNYTTFRVLYIYSFEQIFKDLSKSLLNNPDASNVRDFSIWNEEIFEIMQVQASQRLQAELKFKLKDNTSEFYAKFRSSVYRILNTDSKHILNNEVSVQKKKSIIDTYLGIGMIKKSDLYSFGYYDDMTLREIEESINKGELTREEGEFLGTKRLLGYHERKEQKVSKEKLKRVMNLISCRSLITMFLSDELTVEEFQLSQVEKEDLFTCGYEGLIAILSEMDKFPKRLVINSKDIINQYGRTLTGTMIYKLIRYGYVQEEDVIDIVRINRILAKTDYDEDFIFDDDEVKSYYDSERIFNMYKQGKLNPEFLEKLISVFEYDKNEQVFENKSKMLIAEIKKQTDSLEEKTDDFYSALIDMFKFGLCDKKTFRDEFNIDYLENQYMNDKISISEILLLYQLGGIDADVIAEYYSIDDMINLYKESKIPVSALSAVKDKESLFSRIETNYVEDDFPIEDIMVLYFSLDTINVSQLGEIVDLSSDELDVAAFVDAETGFDKIKELFEYKIIDYSSLTVFRDQGYITEEEFKKIREVIDKEEFFSKLKGTVYKVITERKTVHDRTGEIKASSSVEHKEDKSMFDSEIELLSRILSIDMTSSDYATIESYNEAGRPTTLNNYRIYGNSENGLVVFRKSEKSNAIFIMPFYQAAYFLNGEEQNGEVEIKNRIKDKAYLKTLDQVRVIIHTEHLGRNIVEAVCELSPDLVAKLKSETGYVQDVEEMVKRMQKEYRISKGLDERDN